MRRLPRAPRIALFLCLGALRSAAAEEGERPQFFVDPKDGVIDGRTAVNVFPVEFQGGGPFVFLDPAGLEVHLTLVDHPEVERVYPAGSWFQPPHGRHRAWLEGGWRMSPYSMLMNYAGQGAAGLRGPLPIGGAGRVALPAEWEPTSDEVFELLHAGEYLEGSFPRWEISRRTPTAEVGEGLLMPAGTAVGGVWSRRDRSYLALSRPFRVRAGETTEIALDRPQGLAHLVVELRRSSESPTSAERDVTVALERDGQRLPPDLKVLTADRVYAVWYDLEPGPAVLDAEAPRNSAARRPLTLMAGQIDRQVCDLEPLPALEVALELPRAVREGGLALELRALPGGEIVERRTVPPNADSSRFERLPLELLEVRLLTRFGAFTEQVDLRSGANGFAVLKPDLIVVRGTVYRGDAPYSAKVEFTSVAGEATKAQTDEDGAYEVVALRPLRSVAVSLAGTDGAPYLEVYWRPIAASRELDFHFPEVDFTARVLDATTGAGIPHAAVTTRNTFTVTEEDPATRRDGDDAGRGEEEERLVAQSVAADETGLARLPPLREGTVEIGASAEGYEALPEPVVAEVFDARTGQDYEVRLQPIGSTAALRLQLSGGGPAAGAEILLVDSLATGSVLLSARADAEGRVELPRNRAGGVVLARHSEAGFLVGEWQPPEGEDEVVGVLPPAAGRRLVLAVKDASGERPVAHAEVALWVDGRRLAGPILGWLAGGRPMSDPNGFWTASNLPAAPVAVLAWGLRARDEAAAGHLDSQAVTFPFPWPEPLEVRAIE